MRTEGEARAHLAERPAPPPLPPQPPGGVPRSTAPAGTVRCPLSACFSQTKYTNSRLAPTRHSPEPNRLNLISTADNAMTPVDLPQVPTSVSVGSDGLFAAVGHNASMSYVDLVAKSVLKTIPVTTDALDVVLAGNGRVYVSPRHDQWQTIRCIEIATGQETQSTGNLIYAGTVAGRHPNGAWMYGPDRGVTPEEIEKYDISAGIAAVVGGSPYHGEYPFCGNLWISEDGLRIFTACGAVLRSSSDRSSDMTYNGRLPKVSRIVALSHSAASGRIAAVVVHDSSASPSSTDSEVRFYSSADLSYQGSAPIPPFPGSGGDFESHGRYVFLSDDGARQYVLVQAAETSGILNDWGVTTLTGPGTSYVDEIYIAGAASLEGAPGANWKTDLEIVNPGSGSGNVRIELLPLNEESVSPRAIILSAMWPKHSVRNPDVLQTFFGFRGAASLRLSSVLPGLLVTSRTTANRLPAPMAVRFRERGNQRPRAEGRPPCWASFLARLTSRPDSARTSASSTSRPTRPACR